MLEPIKTNKQIPVTSFHSLSREYKGQSESQTITPKCSCGWIGRTVFQYEDTPIMDLIAQETEHMRTVNGVME